MIRFFVDYGDAGGFFLGQLVYRTNDLAFAMEPSPADADSCVEVNTLCLLVERVTHSVEGVDGYCPYHSWRRRTLAAPRARRGTLRVEGPEFKRGIAYGLNAAFDDSRWPIDCDPIAGVVCVGNSQAAPAAEAVEFASGCSVVLLGDQLVALWLRPKEWPEVVAPEGVPAPGSGR